MRRIIILIFVICVIVGFSIFLFITNSQYKQNGGFITNVPEDISESGELSGDAYLANTSGESGEVSNTEKKDESNSSESKTNLKDSSVQSVTRTTNYTNSLSDMDLSYLKMEYDGKNIIYSPLSIKYALKMLEDGADGSTKKQINDLLGDYSPNRYASNLRMSLANALFVRDVYKDGIKQSYIDELKSNYSAELKIDSFENAKNINNWIKQKTLGIIPQLLNDEDLEQLQFALVNALAIDMEWVEKFANYNNYEGYGNYSHENVSWSPRQSKFTNLIFKNDKNSNVASLDFVSYINNYDIIKELGEDNIRKTVGDAYNAERDKVSKEDYGEYGVKQEPDDFLNQYIEEIKRNYHQIQASTDFYIYTNDDVKAFAKDLKKYGNTTLQYVAIMPIKDKLDTYINKVSKQEINYIFNNFKNAKDYNDFNEGVLTYIYGTMPIFKFEYSLNLMADLKKQGINDVFMQGIANLSKISNEDGLYISDALHKANIELSNDGITASAVTMIGGAGAGSPFDYLYDVPVVEIDMNFDKPYLFFIRDKETEEIWFVGAVEEPTEYDEENSSIFDYD